MSNIPLPKVAVPLSLKGSSQSVGCKNHIRASYLHKLMSRGLFPLLVSSLSPDSFLEYALNEAQGLLLVGGTDVEPMRYGEEPHKKTDVSHRERDHVELFMIERAIKKRLPILGICRGCQVLGVYSGGKLIQHIPDLNTGEEHGLDEYEALANNSAHDVYIEKESKAYKLLQKDKVIANSKHHQAVQSVGSDFLISGKSPAGIVEIIEHRDPNYFCFGVQSHPEAFHDGLRDLDKFFDQFAAELNKKS